MNKTSTISARIDPETKEKAEQASQAITLFYKQVELQRGLPFPIQIPKRTTQRALDEAKDRESLARFDTKDALFDEFGI